MTITTVQRMLTDALADVSAAYWEHADDATMRGAVGTLLGRLDAIKADGLAFSPAELAQALNRDR